MQTKYLKIYREYKEIHDYYKNKTLYPDRYFRMHEQEILLFEEAESELKKIGNEIPNKAQLEYKMTEHNSNMTAVREKLIELREELRSYTTLKHNLDGKYQVLLFC